MKALVFTGIRELQLQDVPEPGLGAPDQVLVKVEAAGICGSDLHGYTGETGRREPPLIMGHEAAGTVVRTGAAVTGLEAGDRVAIQPLRTVDGRRSLMGMNEPGAYAEYVAWPAGNLYPLPAGLTFEQAALAEPLAVAVRAAARIPVTQDGSVLVVGAGPIGLLVAQVLRQRGWADVLISDLAAPRLEIVRELGFTAVNAAPEGAFHEALRGFTDGRGVDAAFEAVGTGPAVVQALQALRYGGSAVWVGNNHRLIQVDMQDIVTRELSIHGTYGLGDDDFSAALELLASGGITAGPLISRRASLAEGPALFEELLASPELIKGMFLPGS